MDNGIVGVLAHHIQPARLGADGCHLLSYRHVQVLQETCGTLIRVVGENKQLTDEHYSIVNLLKDVDVI